MALTHIARIDALVAGAADARPIVRGDEDRLAVAAVQDLLAGQGYGKMPGLSAPDRGQFGPKTAAAIADFRAQAGLSAGDTVDRAVMAALVARPAVAARASGAYLALVLDMEFAGLVKVLSLISQCEGQGRFDAQNRNTDRQGLSYGLLQWAQRQERLREVVGAFNTADRARFVAVLGGGQVAAADGLLAHLARPAGGVDGDGHTTDPAFDLVASPWTERFAAGGAEPVFQRAQVATAVAALSGSRRFLGRYAPEVTSERCVAFMLDMANQYGDGGAKGWYLRHRQPAPAATISAIAAADTTYADRRRFFLQTLLLGEDAFAT